MSADPPAGDATVEDVGELSHPAWQTRFFEPGDEVAVAQMLSRAFSKWPRIEVTCSPSEHLRWKLSSHPEAGPLSIVTEHEGRVVGWQGYWLHDVMLQGRELLSRQAVDFAVDPDFQRMGIKIAMREKAQVGNQRRNFKLHFEPTSHHPAFLHRRLQMLGTAAARGALAHRVASRVMRAGETAAASSTQRTWDVCDVPAFDERVDDLWQEASPEFVALVVRRQQYLNWRYADPRAGRYTISISEQGGRLLGYAVSRLSFGRGAIVDLLALPGRNDVVCSLVEHAVVGLNRASVSEIECWLPEHDPYWAALGEYRFDHKRRTIHYRLAPAIEYIDRIDVPFLDDPKAPIHVTMGDSDVG